MAKLVVEVGMELDKHLIYYHDMLVSDGLSLSFACITHDIYYTKENLDGLSENQMKNACIRLRKVDRIIGANKDKTIKDEEIKAKETELISKGYRKVFDTIKLDFMSLPSIYKDILEDYFKRFDFWGTLDIKNGVFDEISGKAHILSKHIKDFIGYTTNLRTIRQNFYFMPYSITGISMTSSH